MSMGGGETLFVELSPVAGLIRLAGSEVSNNPTGRSGVSNNPTGRQSGIWVELLGAVGNKEMENCQ